MGQHHAGHTRRFDSRHQFPDNRIKRRIHRNRHQYRNRHGRRIRRLLCRPQLFCRPPPDGRAGRARLRRKKHAGERVCRAGVKIARIGMGKKQPRHRRNAESCRIGCRNRRLGSRTQDRNSESVWQRQTQHSATPVRTASCPSRQQHRHEQCEPQCGTATED